jgi:hypothetical protein
MFQGGLNTFRMPRTDTAGTAAVLLSSSGEAGCPQTALDGVEVSGSLSLSAWLPGSDRRSTCLWTKEPMKAPKVSLVKSKKHTDWNKVSIEKSSVRNNVARGRPVDPSWVKVPVNFAKLLQRT